MVSLTDALLNARDIRSIGGDMPIQTPAIFRLLLTVLYGLYPGGPSLDEWHELWNYGLSDGDIIDYLDQYADRWNLFDEHTPFFQVADLHTEKGTYSGLEKLIFDVPNGAPFFTTRLGEGLQRISFAEAVRWLVTAQAFDPSGIKSGAVGDPRVKGGKGYPIGIAWTGNLGVLICEGANLWQTLLLNFVGSELNPHGEPLPWSDDMPAWERPQPTALATPGLDQEHPGDV
ncbi:type I-E CRISPR-associated protein Cse1/CasA, partial [uncultured Bifidobacterium sp.]|uniref:type I-E CRISPR-associated protein Cse1/CasA n=1 Tax=uncultured Bifidobacterium sp. TaxID=165187 RepID=UPI00259978CF